MIGRSLTHGHGITPGAAQAGDAMTGRVIVLGTVAMAVAAIGTTMGAGITPRFVWNASASVPIGLYSVHLCTFGADTRQGGSPYCGRLLSSSNPGALSRQ
jgi:hypothetical protein